MSYLTENTVNFRNRDNPLKIISVYCEHNITRKNAVYEKDSESLMLKRVLHRATVVLIVKNCVSLLWKATVRIAGTQSWFNLSSVTLPNHKKNIYCTIIL
jgi:hypothetical protein